jgi:hypothetical protein
MQGVCVSMRAPCVCSAICCSSGFELPSHRQGYDRYGFDKAGYDKDNYDKNGIHKDSGRMATLHSNTTKKVSAAAAAMDAKPADKAAVSVAAAFMDGPPAAELDTHATSTDAAAKPPSTVQKFVHFVRRAVGMESVTPSDKAAHVAVASVPAAGSTSAVYTAPGSRNATSSSSSAAAAMAPQKIAAAATNRTVMPRIAVMPRSAADNASAPVQQQAAVNGTSTGASAASAALPRAFARP